MNAVEPLLIADIARHPSINALCKGLQQLLVTRHQIKERPNANFSNCVEGKQPGSGGLQTTGGLCRRKYPSNAKSSCNKTFQMRREIQQDSPSLLGLCVHPA